MTLTSALRFALSLRSQLSPGPSPAGDSPQSCVFKKASIFRHEAWVQGGRCGSGSISALGTCRFGVEAVMPPLTVSLFGAGIVALSNFGLVSVVHLVYRSQPFSCP